MNQRDTQETKTKPPEDEASLDRVQSERGDALKEILALVREMSERELAPIEQTNEHMYNILQEEEETLPVEFRNFAIDIFRRSNTLRRSLYERIAGVQHLFKSKEQKFKIEDEMLADIDPRFLSPKDVQKLLLRVQQRVTADGGIEFRYGSTAKESALNNLIPAARSIQGGVRKNAEEDTWQAIAESCKETAIAYYRKTRIGRDYEKFPLVDDTPEILRDAYHTAVIRVIQQKEQDAELRFIEYQKYLEKNFDFDRARELLSVGGSKTSVEALFGSDPIPHEYIGNLEDVVANMALHKAALQVADIQHHSWEVDDDTTKHVKARVASDFPTYIRAVYELLHDTPEACIQAFKGLLQVSSLYDESHRSIFQYMAGTHTHAYSGVERINTYTFSPHARGGETTIGELLQNNTGSTFTVDSPVQIQQILDFLEEIREEFPYAKSISSLFVRRLDTDIAKEEKNNSTYRRNDHKTSELKEHLQLPEESEMINRFADVLGDSSLGDSEFLASYIEWCKEEDGDVFYEIDEEKYRFIIFTGIQQYEHKQVLKTLKNELRDRVREIIVSRKSKSDVKRVFDDILIKAFVYVDIRTLPYFVQQYGEIDMVKTAMLKKNNNEIASSILSLGQIAEYIDDHIKLIEIAKLRPINIFLREATSAGLEKSEITAIVEDKENEELASVSLSEIEEYVERSRFIDIAKLKRFNDTIQYGKFTLEELTAIAFARPLHELLDHRFMFNDLQFLRIVLVKPLSEISLAIISHADLFIDFLDNTEIVSQLEIYELLTLIEVMSEKYTFSFEEDIDEILQKIKVRKVSIRKILEQIPECFSQMNDVTIQRLVDLATDVDMYDPNFISFLRIHIPEEKINQVVNLLKNELTPEERQKKLVAQFKERSKVNTQVYEKNLVNDMGRKGAEQLIRECKDTLTPTINISFESISKVLEAKRCKSCWETRTRDFGNYNFLRHQVEYSMGIRSKGTDKDPHPIYGALATIHDDEMKKGAASSYGSCFFQLKKERIQDRSFISYGDSFRRTEIDPDQHDQDRFIYADAAIAKARMIHEGKKRGYQYVEIQVIGGVSLEDIESVHIPNPTPEQMMQISLWQEQHPSLSFITHS